MKKIVPLILSSFVLITCSKSNELDQAEEVVEEFIQIYSCASYDDLLDPNNTDQDDLMQYWTKFVEDVKCSRGGPDYGERNPS